VAAQYIIVGIDGRGDLFISWQPGSKRERQEVELRSQNFLQENIPQ
jgi:hypothetical protein